MPIHSFSFELLVGGAGLFVGSVLLYFGKQSKQRGQARIKSILALNKPLGLRPNQIGVVHGFSDSTSSNLRNRFNVMGPQGCRYQFNELASLGRCKLSFEAQERAVAIVKPEALLEEIRRPLFHFTFPTDR